MGMKAKVQFYPASARAHSRAASRQSPGVCGLVFFTSFVTYTRKFDANVAIVFKKAPRLSSAPVSSSRAGASTAGGATSSATSVGLTDSVRSRSEASAISALSVIRHDKECLRYN